ncbi:sugar phosphate isomerase/epimerase [Candidatus Pacearchaeota archaeon]|nr:sugar phosphate isomerase/epimerase [Candidatus Pacearchaeota archaeon]
MTKEGYTIGNIYQGGYSSLSPSYGDVFTGYHVTASELGAPTKPDTANQIQQVNSLLNQGIVPIEVGALQPEVFDQIPKQHFKEINRMAKLTGAKISVHAPLIEPSGIGEQGWSESNRQLAERQLSDVVEKSIEMDDKGGMPITIHSAGIPGTEYKMTPEGKKVEKLMVINQETGKPAPLEEEIKHYPGVSLEKLRDPEIRAPEKELKLLNDSEWDNSLSQIIYYKEGADKIISENIMQIPDDILKETFENLEKRKALNPVQQQAYGHLVNAQTYLQNTHQHINGLFHKAYKYGTEDEKKELEKASEEFKNELPKGFNLAQESKALQGLMMHLKGVNPDLYIPIEDFAVKHSSQTFANVAFNAFDKFKDKAPKICIENLFPGMAFAYGEGMDSLITESKKKFVAKAIEKGYSDSEARMQADKMIGMTLDVGHLNIAKKKGFEDKDLLKEVEQIAKHVKHVHLTDNFGYGDSHLPPGMGNVPFKEILEKLEKAGTLKDARKIVEAGGFVQQFGQSPYPISLEAMGSPIYSMQMSPYWNQASALQQGYFSGYGQMLPQKSYETFGAGFSQLPQELGGQAGGTGSRMSGRPME